MYYKPHLISFRRSSVVERDEYGRPVSDSEVWQPGGEGRCDDNSVEEIVDEVGHVLKPKYKIVIEGFTTIMKGDFVEVTWKRDCSLRGKGKVVDVRVNNYLPFSVVWV